MSVLVVFLPLLAAIIAGALVFASPETPEGKAKVDKAAQWITCGALLASAALSVLIFMDVAVRGNPSTVELFTWIDSGSFEVSWALKVDTLTAVMLLVVTGVS